MMKLQSFEEVNFAGFNDNVIKQIKEDCLRFVNFKFALNCNECELSITGAVFNNNNNYYLYKIKGGLDVQVTPKHRNNLCYEYGIMIFEEDDMIKFHVYHNGHGPFC